MDFAWHRARRIFALVAVLAASALTAFAQIPSSITHALANSTAGDFRGWVGMRVDVKAEGEACQISFNNGASWSNVAAGSTVNIKVAVYDGMPYSFDPLNHQKITWSGLSAASSPVKGTAPEVRRSILWRPYSGGTQYSLEWKLPAIEIDVTYGAGPYIHYLNHAPTTLRIQAADGTAYVDGPGAVVLPPKPHQEIMLLLDNQTGQEKEIAWGDKLLKLAPGVNQIRYDGPVDPQTGMPTVRPDDFQGKVFDGNGTRYVHGLLDNSNLDQGEVTWKMDEAPAPQVISPGNNTTRGDTILFPNLAGGGKIVTLPAAPKASPSNTTGDGNAVLSNPTDPKPPQSTYNTTNNITTNNTTNNIENTTNNSSVNVVNEAVEQQENEGDGGPPPNLVGPNLGDMANEAGRQASGIMDSLNQGKAKAEGFWKWKFWGGEGAGVGGEDASWLKFKFTYSPGKEIEIEIPRPWIDLIRGLLLWLVKIGFVMSVIKLFMR